MSQNNAASAAREDFNPDVKPDNDTNNAAFGYVPCVKTGLTNEQVQQRKEMGQTNAVHQAPSKTYRRIFADNIFTLFNTINAVLGFMLFSVGAYIHSLFLGVVISNTCLGIIQEIRAKRTIEKLSLIVEPHVNVIRDGQTCEIPVEAIVLDDIIELNAGCQICSDARVLTSKGLEVDESLLTGESLPIRKHEGDEVLSGSFVVAGSACVHVLRVGKENYATKLAHEARRNKRIRSKLIIALNRIIKVMTFVIIPAGLLLLVSQMIHKAPYEQAIIHTVAGIIGMIPEGLILLSTVAFAVGVINLSKHKTLVQALPCLETLARVDVLCLDKTGTITDGTMEVEEVIICSREGHISKEFDDTDDDDNDEQRAALAHQALKALVTVSTDTNPTQMALKRRFNQEETLHNAPCAAQNDEPQTAAADDDHIVSQLSAPDEWSVLSVSPFSSQRRWSGACFAGSSWVLGSPDDISPHVREMVAPYASQGLRVLALARVWDTGRQNQEFGETLPDKRELYALIVLSDTIRPEAPDTFTFFAQQGVQIKVISGDNPMTVAATAQKAGLAHADQYIDMSTVAEDDDWLSISEQYTVFGRVDPYKKKKLIESLRANDHIVGMTGDGVNDVLALKESDCSIAMASGSDAARAVSELVLLESNFAALPAVVHEGRRVINNIERVSVLYLGKTVYSTLLCFSFILLSFWLNQPYPFVPLNFTLISATCIGIPSFFLALSGNKNRVEGNFMQKTLTKVAPCGILAAFNVLVIHQLGEILSWGSMTDTLRVFALGSVSLMVLANVCSPLQGKRLYLFSYMVLLFFAGFSMLGLMDSSLGLVNDTAMLRSASLFPWWELPFAILVGMVILTAINGLLVSRIFAWSKRVCN
jgi:cation-transporting ATPase E